MSRKPEPLEPWMLDAIELIVRRILTLRQAAQQLGVDITPQQADNIQGRIRFQDALEEARLKYYQEIGSNPRLTRDVVIGHMFKLAERLAADGEDAKASEALFRIAKVQGWTSGEAPEDKPVYANLTQADIDRLRAEINAKQEQQEQASKPTKQIPAKAN
ncbi:MAG TPA: hypothetical protein VMI32_13000 [Candidatus Solibacter sp.]|nr:hypothetical protein [Candidatus Solibacter sp.]